MTVENFTIIFALFLWKIAIRPALSQTPISHFGQLTLFLILPFSRYSIISLIAILAQLSSDSSVEAPRWGMTIQPSCPTVVEFAKSETYFLTFPALMEARTAFSSTSKSLAKFKRITPSFIFSNASLPIIPFVASISGTCIVIISHSAQISSTFSTCFTSRLRFHAASTDTYGSYPYTSIPICFATFATLTPMAPKPIMPSFLFSTSVPANFFFIFSASFAIFSLSA